MNLFGWVLLMAVAVVAVADGRVALRRQGGTPALGPSVAVALLAAFAWLAHAEATGAGRLLLLGLLLTLVGGPLLRRAREAGGQAGAALTVVLLARLLLVAASLALPGAGRGPTGPTVLSLLLALALGGTALWQLGARTGDPTARGVVTAYGVVVLGGVALVVWHGVLLSGVGLSALAVADLVLGWSWLARRAVPQGVVVAALLVRHLGTALVVVGVVRPDLTA